MIFGWPRQASVRRRARMPRGVRAYAIGDIHGRDDLLGELLSHIEREIAERPARDHILVFLGDLIDRGPSSNAVVERLRTLSLPATRAVFLAGNHEEALLRILDHEDEFVIDWLRFGGAQCLASYGVDPVVLAGMGASETARAVRCAIPPEHAAFLRSFGDTLRVGDYLFVHAGIRPGVPLARQSQNDLRWIRRPFLDDERDHGFVVVHGHTISVDVDEAVNRIGIDTGAYHSGILTALVVEGDQRHYLQTGGKKPTLLHSAKAG